jgi:DNA-binding NtrC family response regulator
MKSQGTISAARTGPQWVGDDPASEKLRAAARRLAQTHSTLLVRGESGTGKNLFAEIVHYLGPRRDQPLLKIDCATLPEGLIESELFGHEKGAFTGAVAAKVGRMEMAGKGTLVLDEVAALAPAMQAKLLRVVDQRTFERLGGHRARRLEARIIALTAADLERAVKDGSFREDLFFRLAVVPVVLPPLRERPQDVRPLAEHFLAQLARWHSFPNARISGSALEALPSNEFPGNARELRNILERALIEAGGEEVRPEHLPVSLAAGSPNGGKRTMTLEEMEKTHIRYVLEATHRSMNRAAAILGISRKTLLLKRKRYHLD